MCRKLIRLTMLILCIFFVGADLFAQQKNIPNVAYQDHNVRLTLITKGVIRMLVRDLLR